MPTVFSDLKIQQSCGFEFDLEFDPNTYGYDNYIVSVNHDYTSGTSVPTSASGLTDKEYGVGFTVHFTRLWAHWQTGGGAGSAPRGNLHLTTRGFSHATPDAIYPTIPKNTKTVITITYGANSQSIVVPDLSSQFGYSKPTFIPIYFIIKNNENIQGISKLSISTTQITNGKRYNTVGIGCKKYSLLNNASEDGYKPQDEIWFKNLESRVVNNGYYKGFNYAYQGGTANETTDYMNDHLVCAFCKDYISVSAEGNLLQIKDIHVKVTCFVGDLYSPESYAYPAQGFIRKYRTGAYNTLTTVPDNTVPSSKVFFSPNSMDARRYSIINPAKVVLRHAFMLFNPLRGDNSYSHTEGTKTTTYRQYFYVSSLCIKNVTTTDSELLAAFNASYDIEESQTDLNLSSEVKPSISDVYIIPETVPNSDNDWTIQ